MAHAACPITGTSYPHVCWVKGTGSSVANGYDSLSNAMSLSRACAVAVAGDTVKFNHSSFRGQTIRPSNSGTNGIGGTGGAIVFMGDPLNPQTISIGGIDCGHKNYTSTAWRQYIRCVGLRVTSPADVSIQGAEQAGSIMSPNIFIGQCLYDSLAFYDSTVLIGWGANDCRFDRCSFLRLPGTGSDIQTMQFFGRQKFPAYCTEEGVRGGTPLQPNIDNYCRRDTMSNCIITLSSNRSGGGSGSPMMKWNAFDTFVFTRNVVTLIADTGADGGLLKHYGVQYSQFLDNKFTFRNNNPAGVNETGFSYVREFSIGNNWQRDTILCTGSSYIQTFLTNSGTCYEVRDNVWNQCVFRDSVTHNNGYGMLAWQGGFRGEQFTNNLVIGVNGPIGGWVTGAVAGYIYPAPLVANNTFISLDPSPTSFVGNTMAGALGQFYGNIFYAANDTTVSDFDSNGIYAQTNYNLYWSAGAAGDSLKAVRRNGTKQSLTTTCTSGQFQECGSTYADPLFASVTTNPMTFDAHLKPGSPARGLYASKGLDAGCYQFGGTITPPSQAVFFVKPTARGGTYAGTGADTSNAITLLKANQSAIAGQTYVLMGGDYTAEASNSEAICGSLCTNITAETGQGICPLNDGIAADSANAIRYMSYWYYRASVQGVATASDTNSYRLTTIAIAHSFIQVSGVSSGAIMFLSKTRLGLACDNNANPAAWCYRAISDSLTYCKGTPLQVQAAVGCAIRNCWFITPLSAGAAGATSVKNYLLGGGAQLHGEQPGCNGVSITDTYFRVGVNYNQHGIEVGGMSQNITFARCTMIGDMLPSAPAIANGDSCVFLALRNCHDVFVTDCHFKVNSGPGETNPIYGTADSVSVYALTMSNGFNAGRFTRDTLDLGFRAPQGAALPGAVIQIGTLGGFGSPVANQPIEDVKFTGCLVRGDYMWRQVNKLANAKFSQSVFGSKRMSAMSMAANCDSLSFDQCTFYTDSLKAGTARFRSFPALLLRVPLNTQLVAVTRCLFYRAKVSIDPPLTETPSGAIVQYGCTPTDASKFRSDNNLYYNVAQSDDSSRTQGGKANCLYIAGWTTPGALTEAVALANSPVVPSLPYHTGSEASSIFGTPAFADASVDSTFSGGLACAVASANAYTPWYSDPLTPEIPLGSCVGGIQNSSPTPGRCTALHTSAYAPTTLTITFTGAANDSLLNRGTPSYEIWYGTNPSVTGGTYSIQLATGTTPGATITQQIGSVTPLANSTVYFYLIHTRSLCGTLGPESVVSCGKTQTGAATGGGDETICQ